LPRCSTTLFITDARYRKRMTGQQCMALVWKLGKAGCADHGRFTAAAPYSSVAIPHTITQLMPDIQ
jgi:hypothetical protein